MSVTILYKELPPYTAAATAAGETVGACPRVAGGHRLGAAARRRVSRRRVRAHSPWPGSGVRAREPRALQSRRAGAAARGARGPRRRRTACGPSARRRHPPQRHAVARGARFHAAGPRRAAARALGPARQEGAPRAPRPPGEGAASTCPCGRRSTRSSRPRNFIVVSVALDSGRPAKTSQQWIQAAKRAYPVPDRRAPRRRPSCTAS